MKLTKEQIERRNRLAETIQKTSLVLNLYIKIGGESETDEGFILDIITDIFIFTGEINEIYGVDFILKVIKEKMLSKTDSKNNHFEILEAINEKKH